MSYSSLTFLGFAAAVALIYYTLGRRRQSWVLALSNLTFYAIAGLEYLPFLLATLLATFFAAKRIDDIYAASNDRLAACKAPGEKKLIRAEAKARAKKSLTAGGEFQAGCQLSVC